MSLNAVSTKLEEKEKTIDRLKEEIREYIGIIQALEIEKKIKQELEDSQNSSMSQDTDADGSKYANENVAAFQKLSEQLSLIEKSLKENADTKTKDIKKIDDASKNIIKHLQKMETDYNEIVNKLNETTSFNEHFLYHILDTKLSSSEQEKEIDDIKRLLDVQIKNNDTLVKTFSVEIQGQIKELNKLIGEEMKVDKSAREKAQLESLNKMEIVHRFTVEIHEQIKELNKLIEEEMKVDKSAREKAQLESLNKQILTVKNRTDDITRLNEEIRMRFVPDLAKTLVEIIERIFQKNQAAKN